MIKEKVRKSVNDMQVGLVPPQPITYSSLVPVGLTESQLRKELMRYKSLNDDVWKEGKVSGNRFLFLHLTAFYFYI